MGCSKLKENNHSDHWLDLGKYSIGIPENDKFFVFVKPGLENENCIINGDCESNTREVTNTFAMNFFPSKPQGELNSFARALEMSLADCFALF